MAFYGETFSFDGVSCETYELMMYEVGGSDAQGATKFAGTQSIVEEYLPSRWKPLFIGTRYENKLEFSITFGVNQTRIDEGKYLSRTELANIAAWLTGHSNYKYLSIGQDDMSSYRYKCFVTQLTTIDYGSVPWAITATIVCDSPFGYMLPRTYTYTISGSQTITFNNLSNVGKYYMPKITFIPNDNDAGLIIRNLSDKDREFQFYSFPGAVTKIYIDNENCLITNSADLNLYKYFNFNFLRLIKGTNTLEVEGNGTLIFECEYPIDIGG